MLQIGIHLVHLARSGRGKTARQKLGLIMPLGMRDPEPTLPMVVGDAVWPCVRLSMGTSANSTARRLSSEMILSMFGRI